MPDEILKNIGTVARFEITKKQLVTNMKNLVLDGYIDFSETNNKEGQMMYVVTLTTRGEAFQREHMERVKNRWRDVGWKIAMAAAGAVVTVIIFKILGR
jgi:DNA-binding PadR family transcriptional regulator